MHHKLARPINQAPFWCVILVINALLLYQRPLVAPLRVTLKPLDFGALHEGGANKVHTITMLMRKQGTVNRLYMQRMCQKGSLGTSDLKADMNTLVTLKVRVQRLLRDIPNLKITQRIVIELKPTIVIGEDQLATRTQ